MTIIYCLYSKLGNSITTPVHDKMIVCMCICLSNSGLGGVVHLQGPPEWDTINRQSRYQPQFDNTTYSEPVLQFVWSHWIELETGTSYTLHVSNEIVII